MADLAPKELPQIGVVTVTFNSEPVLQEFFDSLFRQSYPRFTLYVVDNNSSDRTLAMCRERTESGIKVRANKENLGVATANNQGIREAIQDGCEEILLLNNDTVLSDDMIWELHRGLERFHADMTTCKMYYHDAPDVLWCAGGHFQRWRGMDSVHDGPGQKDSGQFNSARRISYSPTCCLLVRRSVFDKVGMMDDQYFVYYDDSDFLLRCLRKGVALWYIPGARLWHKVSFLTSPTSDFTNRYCARNRIYYLRKHLSPLEARFWYLVDQIQYAMSVLLLRSSLHRWRIRRRAAHEGLSMQTN